MDLGDRLSADLAARLDELERTRSSGVEARLEQARRLQAQAFAAGDVVAEMRARLVLADMLHRVGEVGEGAALAVRVNTWALRDGPPALLARSHLVLSSLFEEIGDVATGLDHAVRAIDLLGDDAPTRVRGIHLLRLADALAVNGSADESRRRYREAEEAFACVGDRHMLRTVLNNLAMLEYEVRNVAGALDVVRELQGPDGGAVEDAALADTVARVHLAAGDLAAAEQVLALGDRLLGEQGDVQAVTPAELALTRAEVLLARGRTDRAAAELDRCFAICAERDLAGVRVHALGVRAEVLAAAGRWEEAYRAHRTFHTESVALRSHQQEAAARTRQALFETAEAQRAAQRFREQARTDPLTGLYNRRLVDEELPRYLTEVTGHGGCLVAALVDVDHFKAVNDVFSHAVGDDVLRVLGRRLAAVVGQGPDAAGPRQGLAARLGGEEFLVVLVTACTTHALDLLEGLRRDLAAADWSGLAAGLRVTVSIGATRALPTDTQLTLLTRADEYLYRAKQTGRDRLVTDRDGAGAPRF